MLTSYWACSVYMEEYHRGVLEPQLLEARHRCYRCCPAEEASPLTLDGGSLHSSGSRTSSLLLFSYPTSQCLADAYSSPQSFPSCVSTNINAGNQNIVSYPPPETPIKCRAFSQVPTPYLFECGYSIRLIKAQQFLHILLVHLHQIF